MSDILSSVHQTIISLHASGAVDGTTLKEFGALCSVELEESACSEELKSCSKGAVSLPIEELGVEEVYLPFDT